MFLSDVPLFDRQARSTWDGPFWSFWSWGRCFAIGRLLYLFSIYGGSLWMVVCGKGNLISVYWIDVQMGRFSLNEFHISTSLTTCFPLYGWCKNKWIGSVFGVVIGTLKHQFHSKLFALQLPLFHEIFFWKGQYEHVGIKSYQRHKDRTEKTQSTPRYEWYRMISSLYPLKKCMCI